jgi:surface antigen
MRDGRWRHPMSGRAWLAGAFVVVILMTAATRAAHTQDPSDGGHPATMPDPGQSGEKPVREFNDAAGRLCRVYERAVVIGGEKQSALAVVCREANGRWVLSR